METGIQTEKTLDRTEVYIYTSTQSKVGFFREKPAPVWNFLLPDAAAAGFLNLVLGGSIYF